MTIQSTFAFKARDHSGNVVTGTMVAGNAAEVGTRLRAEGKFVLAVDDNPLRAGAELDHAQVRRSEAARRVKREDVIAFSQQLSVMLETGVPLDDALNSFARQTPSKEFRQVLEVVKIDIEGGETFSVALTKWPRVFPRMMVSLIRASEASGTLALMLGRVGRYLDKERRTLRQIRGALSYPMFMMGAGLILSAFLLVFILPRFAQIYESRSSSLPAPTKILLAVSTFFTTEYMYYGPAVVLIAIAAFLFFRRPAGKRTADWLRLNVPLLRTMYTQLYVTRSASTMSTLLTAGVNLLDIIEICRGITNNACFDEVWTHMEAGVRDGKQISDAVAASRHMPPHVAAMISSGERSGRLDQVMERIAEFSEQELDAIVKQVSSYIEPIMIIFMGFVIGGVAMALLLPIFRMGSVMSGG